MLRDDERIYLRSMLRAARRYHHDNGRDAGYSRQTPHAKQKEFLALDCLEALYGGAAGGGKSSCLLMAALQYVHIPGYSALILRRTYADLALPGAIMDRAREWLTSSDASWSDKLKQWRFPSGAVLQFGYLETADDRYRYQGSELHFCAFDELTQFGEVEYTYLLSRLRRAKGSNIPVRMRAASNPGGRGHKWVHERFVLSNDPERRFVPALVDDNPFVDSEEYRKALDKLDSTTRMQLLDGLWVQDSNALIYKLRSDTLIHELPPIQLQFVLGIDLGASESKPTTAFCVWGFHDKYPNAVWCVESNVYAGMIPSEMAALIQGYHKKYDLTSIVADAGALGKGYVEEWRRRYALPVEPASKNDKLGNRKLLNGDIERGVVKIYAPGNKELINEMNQLQWDDNGLDNAKGQDNHLTDAMLYGWRKARHWLAVAAEPKPKWNTPERDALEAEKMLDAAMKRSRELQKPKGNGYLRGI